MSKLGENKKIKVIGLAGNPNVGKSTVFNALTGLKQHTGNWPGKTVSNASGEYNYLGENYLIYDLPGTYSLIAHSKEEECARDFICFEKHDGIVVVCDAVCLERNLNLVLQTIEITKNVIVVVNLMDEAKKKKIKINLKKLSEELGVPVIGSSARSGKGLEEIMNEITKLPNKKTPIEIKYSEEIENAIKIVEDALKLYLDYEYNRRWLALRLINMDHSLDESMIFYLKDNLLAKTEIKSSIEKARLYLLDHDITLKEFQDQIVTSLVKKAEKISLQVVKFENKDYKERDQKIDKWLTNKWTGIPLMILLLMIVFWLTITGANYPSELLFSLFSEIGSQLTNFLNWISAPTWLISMLIDGIYRVLTWVVAVMLPPMAIFFPLFTLLEDLGYLPRIAFNLDHCFRKCNACGKQALTMCMGFGCNAVGVVGCRIIDSPRERLIAILTNNFVPCNGRFPTIIAIITMFFVGFQNDIKSSFLNVFLLTGAILIGIIMTFLVSKVLSKTLLKGVPSSFTLELPPYRRPQIGKVIVRSILDRTLYVLGRAVAVATPAGLVIWLFANIDIGGNSILFHCKSFLDPFAQFIGLDGAILMGFILGFPANEIVIPIIIMIYMATGSLVEFNNLVSLKELLLQNGWTWLTAVCMILFSLMHFPCSTTCLTIKKETGSWKWTVASILIPTMIGLVVCFLLTTLVKILGIV